MHCLFILLLLCSRYAAGLHITSGMQTETHMTEGGLLPGKYSDFIEKTVLALVRFGVVGAMYLVAAKCDPDKGKDEENGSNDNCFGSWAMVADTSFFFAECLTDVALAWKDTNDPRLQCEVNDCTGVPCDEQTKRQNIHFFLKMTHFVTQMPNGFNWVLTAFPYWPDSSSIASPGVPANPHKCTWYAVRLGTELFLDLLKGMIGDYKTRTSAAQSLGALMSPWDVRGPDLVLAKHSVYAGSKNIYKARFASFLFFISQAFEVVAHCPNVNSDLKEKDGTSGAEEITLFLNWLGGVSYLGAALTNLWGIFDSRVPLCAETCRQGSDANNAYNDMCELYSEAVTQRYDAYGGDAAGATTNCANKCRDALKLLQKKGIWCRGTRSPTEMCTTVSGKIDELNEAIDRIQREDARKNQVRLDLAMRAAERALARKKAQEKSEGMLGIFGL